MGWGLHREPSGAHIASVYLSRISPAKTSRICTRGWPAFEVASSADRRKNPLVRKTSRFQLYGCCVDQEWIY